ncbi:MAG TPA: hypothetical protein VHZ24_06845 [Pirellulales bacterium]|jgi:hypothetical protein|nr:hypothetical protein [Pirellulales bacterium]
MSIIERLRAACRVLLNGEREVQSWKTAGRLAERARLREAAGQFRPSWFEEPQQSPPSEIS